MVEKYFVNTRTFYIYIGAAQHQQIQINLLAPSQFQHQTHKLRLVGGRSSQTTQALVDDHGSRRRIHELPIPKQVFVFDFTILNGHEIVGGILFHFGNHGRHEFLLFLRGIQPTGESSFVPILNKPQQRQQSVLLP